MNLVKIVRKNMQQRMLATVLTAVSVALAVALTVAIVHIKRGMQQRFEQSTLGYEMVVGAKGSPLQLVLNTVFNLDISPGNIPWATVEKLRADKRVKSAVPFSVGDNYRGFRIIGTTDVFGETFGYRLAEGRWFTFSEDALRDAFKEAVEHSQGRIAKEKGEAAPKEGEHHHAAAEAVIGATVARETGLRVGQTFIAAHGVEQSPNSEEHKENPWTVTGILLPTGTAVDRGLYINLDSFYHIEGHEVREKDTDPDPGQVSSVALKLRSAIHAFPLYREINDGADAMAAFPAVEVRKLFSIVGNIDRILLAQAILIGIVAGVAIAVSIYNSMSERRREIAIMRALGAQRGTIFAIVVLEAMAICAVGAVVGVVGGHLIVAGANAALRHPGFDVIVPSNEFVERMAQANMLMPLDHAKIPNFKNVEPKFTDPPYDPGRKWSMPYTWLVLGIGYRKSKVKGIPDSWKYLYDSDQYKGRIALLSESADLIRLGAKYLGHSVNGVPQSMIDQVEAMLIKQKPFIKAFHEDNGQDMLLAGDVDLVMEYNGDIAQIMKEDPDIDFVVPKEGSLLNSDCLCIPAGAPRPNNAHAFINFLLDAKAGAEISETIDYPTPNAAARALMPDSYKNNPVIFPTGIGMQNSEFGKFEGAAQQQAFETAITRVRAA